MNKNELRTEIYRRLKSYPQYNGYYDDDNGWKFAVAAKKISFKSGDVLPGEFLLVREHGTIEFLKNEQLVSLPTLEIVHLCAGWMTSGGHYFPESAIDCAVELNDGKRLIVILE